MPRLKSGDLHDELETARQERDLYLRLLELGAEDEVEVLLADALALLIDATGAHQGYCELNDQRGEPRWSIARGLSSEEVENVRRAVSRGIIAEAVATGQTVATQSAQLDPRFSGRESVRGARLGAVLCSPIGHDPPRGVIYLQAPPNAFSEQDRGRVETLARQLTPLVDRVLMLHLSKLGEDPTQPYRALLRAEGVVGHSPALAKVLEQAALVAPLEVHVLLTGESGTGKSQIARVIHASGPRSTHSFVELNCATLPESLIESELFGASAGAHSTASHRIEGKVAAAQNGTLFLDEIGELSLAAQAKLLQLLQSKQYFPLGATVPTHADVRVIAASNADLRQAVAERRFRDDLLYRLEVFPLRLPALAERTQDIPDLAVAFAETACARHGLPRLGFSPNALRALEAAQWPGNVRQLAHTVERAAIQAAGERAMQIERKHLFPSQSPQSEEPVSETFQEATRRFQARLLRESLEANGWNVVATARDLDLARSHVYNLIRAFGLQRSDK